MPFGLKNAPALFKRAMYSILIVLKWQLALNYLSDIIAYWEPVTEHLVHVRAVLALLRKAAVPLSLPKCSFSDSTVSYPGHSTLPGILAVNKKNCEEIRKSSLPTKKTELRSIARISNLYLRFLSNFAEVFDLVTV